MKQKQFMFLLYGLMFLPQLPAQLELPYYIDGHTLHLWHFDENSGMALDAVGGLNLSMGSGTALGAEGHHNHFGSALDLRAGNVGAGAFGPEDISISSFRDNTTGAFTFEALVSLGFDPGVETRTMQIFSMEDDDTSAANRPFQWRIEWADAQMRFINIGGGDSVQSLLAKLPDTGDHIPVQNAWYHVAVSYDGDEGVAGNAHLYWTRLGVGAVEANALALDPSPFDRLESDLTNSDGDPVVGNESRSTPTEAWVGLIDEVRISKVSREASEFIFKADHDGDGLPDEWEMDTFDSLIYLANDDPDEDGADNSTELFAGSDANNFDSVPGDIDGDHLADVWEWAEFASLVYGGEDDPDGDGFDNAQEFVDGSDPNDPHSNGIDIDGDGMEDEKEQLYFGSLDAEALLDADGDSFNNYSELVAGTDPTDPRDTPHGPKVFAQPVDDGLDHTSEWGYAASGINNSSFIQDNLITVGDQQFITYYYRHQSDADDSQNNCVLIGRRKVGEADWEIFKTNFLSFDINDNHNVIVSAIDGDGFMHMAWGMHNHRLQYAKSITSVLGPSDIQMVEQEMTGQENMVTYPQFRTLPDGDILFMFREFGSGNGNTYLNRYHLSTRSWSPVHVDESGDHIPFYQGRGSPVNFSNNFYPDRMIMDSSGVLHLSGVVRGSASSIQSNRGYYYMQSPDEGVTWQRMDESEIALPISYNSSDFGTDHVPDKAWDIPTNSSLINQSGLSVDSRGYPVIASHWKSTEESGVQYHVLFWDGENWQHQTVSTRSIVPGELGRPIVLLDNRDRILVVFRDDRQPYGVRVVFTMPLVDDPNRSGWSQIRLTSENLGHWDNNHDSFRWEEDGVLQLFYQAGVEGQERTIETPNDASRVYVLEWDARNYFEEAPELHLQVDDDEVSLIAPGKIGFCYDLFSSSNMDFGVVADTRQTGGNHWVEFGPWNLFRIQFWMLKQVEVPENNF